MKKLLLIGSLLVIGLIASFYIGIWVYAKWCDKGDREDRMVAEEIQHYPNATDWKVHDDDPGTCALDAYDYPPSANIYFYSSDNPQQVLDYFKEELPKSGWELRDSNEAKQMQLYDAKGNPTRLADISAKFEKEIDKKVVRLLFEHNSNPNVKSNYEISISGLHPYYQNEDR